MQTAQHKTTLGMAERGLVSRPERRDSIEGFTDLGAT
jgi:hypothetical protein